MFADIKETYYGLKSAQYAAISQITHHVIVESNGTPDLSRLDLHTEDYESYRHPYVYIEAPDPARKTVKSLKVIDGTLIVETDFGDCRLECDNPDILLAQTLESISWFLYNREFKNNER